MRTIATFALVTGLFASVPARAADPSFQLVFEAPQAQTGKRQAARVVVKPGKGYHLNQEFPTSLALTPAAQVTLEKGKLDKKDAKLSETELSYEVGYTAAAPGKYQLTGDLKFAVCSATTCDPKKEKVAFEIQVK